MRIAERYYHLLQSSPVCFHSLAQKLTVARLHAQHSGTDSECAVPQGWLGVVQTSNVPRPSVRRQADRSLAILAAEGDGSRAKLTSVQIFPC